MIPNSTERDEDLARALQTQFQIEAESSLSSAAGGGGNNMNHRSLARDAVTTRSSTSTSNFGITRPTPTASRSISDSVPSTNNCIRPSSTASRHKRSNSGSSPNTAQTLSSSTSSGTNNYARPSSDMSSRQSYYNDLSLYESHLRQLESSARAQRGNNNTGSNSSELASAPSAQLLPTSTTTRSSPRGSPRGSPRNSFHLFNNNSNLLGTEDDEALARRLDQELHDAELAASIERAERASANFALSGVPTPVPSATAVYTNNNNNNIAGRNPPSSQLALAQRDSASTTTTTAPSSSTLNGSCRGRTLHFALRMLVVVLMAGITFIVYVAVFGKQVSDSLDPATWLPGYPESDPSMGSVGKNAKWIPQNGEAEGNGLSLAVLNNLASGSDWDSYLQTAIGDWENGTPDAVTLSLRTMSEYDPDCRAVKRAMKVCNGNYGPTDWRGVNQILLQDNYIVTSLAKMNDYYLEGTDVAQKQYTMCHELGHGLGLGHADENFYNADLGNCMDYTEHPEDNMHPDDTNYEALAELYGVVYYSVSEEMDVPENRMLVDQEKKQRMVTTNEFEKYAIHLMDPIETSSNWMVAEDGVDGAAAANARGSSRLLLKTKTSEHHERDLGNGYTIRTNILLE